MRRLRRLFDPSAIRGLQAPPAAGAQAEGDVDVAARKEALAKELAARAARLAEAVDDALVLANDGAIRWLGDPVAKLAAGEAPLAPRATLLADEALPAESREIAERRVSLWLAEHLRKVLGPLIALADAEAVAEPAREIALKVSQALGVLERERVKAQVKALDQDARGALRKLGVRFGAHYIFVPALLKPAARTLCAHLWALSRSEADAEGAAEKLLHFAASGRTSFAVEPPASGELYRVAGFRLCGERAVRVDIVERLTDLIRAALPRAPAPADAADGFVVTNQMTSLTGCSGEHFASILRSLGFVSHEVKKSAYLAAAALRAAASAPAPQAAQPLANAAGAIEVAAAAEPPPVAAPAGEPAADAAAEPAVEVAAEPPATPAAETVGEPAVEAVAEPAVEQAAEAIAEPTIELTVEATPLAAPAVDEAAADTAVAAAVAETVAEPQADGGDAPAAAAPDGAEPPATEPSTVEDETIEVWKPAPRRPRHVDHRRHVPPEAGAAGEARPRPEEGKGRRPWRQRKEAPSAPAPATAGEAAKGERTGETRRGPPPWRREGGGKGDRRDDRRGAEPAKERTEGPRPAASEPRQPSVNLDSPFAKLLDLKPLLQARDKKR